MHGWLCHFSYMLKFVSSGDCYLVRCESMWVLSICLLCNHWWVVYGSFWNLDETWHVTEFFKLKRKNQPRFFFCTLCSQLLLVFQVLGSTFGFEVHGEEAVMFVNPHAGKQNLCIAKEMYITSICKFIKLCWNDKPGTTLNSTAMSSQLTYCVALCHKIMP
jgi:hypothetical protein